MCGACFAPLLMLRLVHFAADTHLAGDAMGTLRGGMRPVTSRLHSSSSHSGMGRHDLARQQSSSPSPNGPAPVRAEPLPSPGKTTGSSAAASHERGKRIRRREAPLRAGSCGRSCRHRRRHCRRGSGQHGTDRQPAKLTEAAPSAAASRHPTTRLRAATTAARARPADP